jgi:ABC-type multidrug transport system fused ATPase/permease subunit
MGLVLGVGVFAQTSMAIVIIYHLLAGLSLTSFSMLGASFFKKAQLSGISMAIITLLLGVLAQVIDKTNSGTVAILSLLFVPCNYVFFIVFMARYERQNQATDLVRSAPDNPWGLPGIALWVFVILQIFVYPLLGAFIERFLYGTASKGRSVVDTLDPGSSDSPTSFETVRLQNFTKHYRPNWFRRQAAWFTKTPKATVVAVNDLTFSARKGQICVLLGANGSGKSTTLDAIAGLNTVTSGAITVDGTGGLGIAPQKNVLWDELTVEEHIRIFNQLKSTSHRDSKETIQALVKAVDLDRKIGAKSKTLSGGQKRKLQLGMMVRIFLIFIS